MGGFIALAGGVLVGWLVWRHYRKQPRGKVSPLVGAISIGFIAWVGLFALIGQDLPAPPVEAHAVAAPPKAAPAPAAAPDPAPQYAHRTSAATQAAHDYIAQLDHAIEVSEDALPGIDLKTTAGISRHFGDLAKQGSRLFSDHIGGGDLWYCGSAGDAARALWSTRIIAHRATAQDLAAVQRAKGSYKQERDYCLQAAGKG